MSLKIQDLIDIEQFQLLQDRLNEIYSFPSAIIDNDGKVLTTTAWQDVCTIFHRQNRECEKECIKSDQYIADHLHEANPAVSYRCPHGLIDNATPIIIEGVHYGNFFTGQFFLEPPDLNFFKMQAKRYGFDEEAYVEAVKKVPIWTQEQLNSYLFFIKGLIEVIAGIGLKNLKEIEIQKRIQESEERFRTIASNTPDHILMQDRQLRYTFVVNPQLGLTEQDMIGKTDYDFLSKEEAEKLTQVKIRVLESGQPVHFETSLISKEGEAEFFDGTYRPKFDTHGQIDGMIGYFRNVTERKKTEQEMTILAEIGRVIGSTLEIEKVYERMAIEIRKLIPFDSLMVNLRNAQQETLVVTYISGLDIPGRRIGDSFPVRGTIGEEAIQTKRGVVLQSKNPEDLVAKFPGLIVSVRAGMRSIMTVPLIFQDEAIGNLIMRSKKPDTYSEDSLHLAEKIGIQIAGAIANAHLFNNLSKTEKALRESEVNYRQLFENAPAGIYQIDFRTGLFLKANDLICEYLGCSQEEITSCSAYEIMTDESKQLLSERLKKMGLGEKVTENPEYEIVDKKGKRRWLQLHSKNIYNAEGLVIGADVVAHDITERKRAEEKLAQSHDLLTNLARLVPGVVYQYRLYPDGRSAFPYSSPGMNDIYEVTPEDVREDATPVFGRLHPDDYEHIVDSIQESARTLQTFYCEFKVILPRQGLRWRWSQAQPERLVDGSILWHGIISDITERKQIEEQLQQTLKSLRSAVGTTIQTLVAAVEVRDPYTAGHQIRSAGLARAIATEMGLSQDRIDGIRMAGSIHDIGKLSIPAEILSKPTNLTSTEFSLIKEHSLKGYEMLKDVESPWPLAQIVYQHHERMDGSGYPRNLRGDEILMEARILAVSDVVESMASHRPYRPAIGVEAALEEIEKNKGILYDDAVADACLRLFQEKGFKLEGT